jgi:hypothetical protein
MHENLRVSLATGCMNRLDSLRWALPSWLALPEIDEIVIVDWSSQTPVHEALADVSDPRVLFVRVEGQSYWCAARCHNVEVLAATGDALLRIDADIRVKSGFFGAHHSLAREHVFWNTWWRLARDNEDLHLAGTIYTRRSNFLLVGGYNERLASYGYEDDDLYQRLLIARRKRGFLRREDLEHLPHADATRMAQIAPEFRGRGIPIEGIGRNQQIAKDTPWTANDRMTTWRVCRVAHNLWRYTQD